MITLGYPWLIGLILVPLAVLRWVPVRTEAKPSLRAPFVGALERLTGRQASSGRVTPPTSRGQMALTWIVWLLVVLALARPQWVGDIQTKTIATRDLLLAVDLSASMEATDFRAPGGDEIDRLSAVKLVLDDFLNGREGDRVGLILFGSAAFIQTPFTEDIAACRELLEEAQIGMAGPKTMIGDAIGLGIAVFEKSKLEDRTLVLLTDGNDSGSKVPPENAARIAADYGIVIHAIAVGSPTSTGNDAIDEEALKLIAELTGGGFFRASSREELEAIYARIDSLKSREADVLTHRPLSEFYFWPLGAALLLTLVFHVVSAGRNRGKHKRSLSTQGLGA